MVLGTDNRLGYWDTVTGDQIRSVEACRRGRLTAMDLSPDGMSVTHATIWLSYTLALAFLYFGFGLSFLHHLCWNQMLNKLFVSTSSKDP